MGGRSFPRSQSERSLGANNLSIARPASTFRESQQTTSSSSNPAHEAGPSASRFHPFLDARPDRGPAKISKPIFGCTSGPRTGRMVHLGVEARHAADAHGEHSLAQFLIGPPGTRPRFQYSLLGGVRPRGLESEGRMLHPHSVGPHGGGSHTRIGVFFGRHNRPTRRMPTEY